MFAHVFGTGVLGTLVGTEAMIGLGTAGTAGSVILGDNSMRGLLDLGLELDRTCSRSMPNLGST